LNRDKNPLPHDVKKGRPKSPTPTTYKLEKKDFREILSTQRKAKKAYFGYATNVRNKDKLERFIDIHKK